MRQPQTDVGSEKDLPKAWAESDAEYVRVVEDLIQVLIAKRIIKFTDLPPSVQEKTRNRREIRKMMAKMLTDDDDSLRL